MHEVASDPIRAWAKGSRGNREISWPSSVFLRCPKCRERQVFAISTGLDNVLARRPPAPDWKLEPWFEGTLPAGDPALDPSSPTAPSLPQYP